MTSQKNIKIIAHKILDQAQKIISVFQINPMKAEFLETPEQLSHKCSVYQTKAEEIFTSYLEKMGLACWIEIVTDFPKCIYYFGPFASASEAQRSLGGYLEDLQEEKAQIISLNIKRGTPQKLTIFEREMKNDDVNFEFLAFESTELGV